MPGAEADIASQLDAWGKWDIVLIQEGPVSEEDVHELLESGHVWYVSRKGDRPRSVAILLHKRWTSQHARPEYQTKTSRVAYVDVELGQQKIRFITAHLPHAEYTQADFDATLDAVESVIEEMQAFEYLWHRCKCSHWGIAGRRLKRLYWQTRPRRAKRPRLFFRSMASWDQDGSFRHHVQETARRFLDAQKLD